MIRAVALISGGVLGVLIAVILIMHMLPPPDTGDHLDEFSNLGESAKNLGTWQFSAKSGTKTVSLYSYCGSNGCIAVAFDRTNSKPLPDSEALSFFQGYEIYKAAVSDSVYQSPFKQSAICGFAVPELKTEGAEAAADVLASNVGKDTQTSRELTNVAKFAGVLKDVNVIGLGLGLGCLGSIWSEGLIQSDLSSCQSYLQELRTSKMHENLADDLIACNQKVIDKLNQAKWYPDVVIQHMETSIMKGWENFQCRLSHPFGTESCEPNGSSALDNINSKILVVQGVTKELNDVIWNAHDDAYYSNQRVNEKGNQAFSLVLNLQSKVYEMNVRLADHSLLNVVRDWFYKPTFDLSVANIWASQATAKLNQAKADRDTYRLNSAIKEVPDGLIYADNAINAITSQEETHHELDLLHVLFVTLVPLATVAGFTTLRRIM